MSDDVDVESSMLSGMDMDMDALLEDELAAAFGIDQPPEQDESEAEAPQPRPSPSPAPAADEPVKKKRKPRTSRGPEKIDTLAPPAPTATASRSPRTEAAARQSRETYARREKRRREEEVRHANIRASLTPGGALRYDVYRRSKLSARSVKHLLQQLTGTNKMPSNIPSVLSGMGKAFVGEVVETSRAVMEEWQHSGSIQPMHIREAMRRLTNDGRVPPNTLKPSFVSLSRTSPRTTRLFRT